VTGITAALRDEGGLLAHELTGAEPEGDFAVAAIHEGWLLHSEGRSTTLAPDDPDLALLGGDRLYALGLEKLAEDGDLEAIAALADVIAECAQSHAERAPDRAREAWRRLTLRAE
jgi:hypothetical protein